MDMTDLHQAGVPSSKANEDGSQTIPYPAVHTQIAGIYIYIILFPPNLNSCVVVVVVVVGALKTTKENKPL